MQVKRDVNGLVQELGYLEDASVRAAAAKALGEIGDVRTVDPLIAALNDQDAYVITIAARSLAKLGDVRAVEPLIVASKDRDGAKLAGKSRKLLCTVRVW